MEGWVKLHRELLDKPIWAKSTSQQKTILITLLMMANHKPNEWEWKGEKFEVKEGQFVTSIDSIKQIAGKDISTQNVRSALAKFEKYEFLTNKSTKMGRLITIVNWGLYQCCNEEGNKDTNKEVTKRSQRTNKEVTSNKNVRKKECKNDKNKEIYEDIVALTTEEYFKLTERFGYDEATERIERLALYLKSTGKTNKYKCHYSTILSWARKDEKEKPKQTKDESYNVFTQIAKERGIL